MKGAMENLSFAFIKMIMFIKTKFIGFANDMNCHDFVLVI